MLPVFRRTAEDGDLRNPPLHNERPHVQEDGESSDANNDGNWGERDTGGPVNFRVAMQEYEEMRRELSHISQSKSHTSRRSNRSGNRKFTLKKIVSGGNRGQPEAEPPVDDRDIETPPGERMDEEKDEEKDVDEDVGDFQLTEFLRDGHFEKRVEGVSAKRVGVVWKNLTG